MPLPSVILSRNNIILGKHLFLQDCYCLVCMIPFYTANDIVNYSKVQRNCSQFPLYLDESRSLPTSGNLTFVASFKLTVHCFIFHDVVDNNALFNAQNKFKFISSAILSESSHDNCSASNPTDKKQALSHLPLVLWFPLGQSRNALAFLNVESFRS